MAETPLTDSIEALTTYANQVTGASDTNLSDAVYTLAQGYGGGVFNVPRYCCKCQNLFERADLPEVVDLDFENNPYINSFKQMFMNTRGGAETIKLRNLVSPATNFDLSGFIYYNDYTKRIEFIDCDFSPQSFSETFRTSKIEVITGEFDFTNTTSVNQMFNGANKLEEIRFKKDTLKIDMGTSAHLYDCPLLSDDSIVSIANGLSPDVSGTIQLHATPKARCSTLMGTNDNGTFVADVSGTLSLADFIANVKGWTLA